MSPPPVFSRYRGHVPTTLLEKALLAGTSAAQALTDPRNARAVGVVGETTGHLALRRMHARMERHPIGRAVLQDRPLITSRSLPLEWLDGLPANSFGAEYGRFLRRHDFSPDERSDVQFVDDPDLAYVMTRYRQACAGPVAATATSYPPMAPTAALRRPPCLCTLPPCAEAATPP